MLMAFLSQHARTAPFARRCTRSYHDYIRYTTQGGIVRLPLASPKVIGVSSSRGSRKQQEDFYAFSGLSLDPAELQNTVKKHHRYNWDPTFIDDLFRRQALFVGIYDGHGGSTVSQYLRQELHGLIESVNKTNIPELYAWIHELGGYFKRFRGGALHPWIHNAEDENHKYDLVARITQAFFEVDRNLSGDEVAQKCGATASVAILQVLDPPTVPFFSADTLALTVGHVGDTRVLLCSTDEGKAVPMTDNHHADSPVESARLRRMLVSSLMTDSYGETRWMGALQNTRGLGDLSFKKYGVTAEPEVRTKLLKGPEWAFMVLISDGVSSLASDGEVVDIVKSSPTPEQATKDILKYIEDLGGDDNMTAIVVPLPGWGKVPGEDHSKDLREYRVRQAEGTERQKLM